MRTHLDWARLFAQSLEDYFGDRLVSVVVYGSAAVGKAKPGSDIDLLVILKDVKEGAFCRRALLDPLHDEWEKKYGSENPPFLSTLIKSPDEAGKLTPIYFDMTDRRIFLLDRNQFMEKTLADIKKRLDRLGAIRRRLGKIEYWDLKPDYKPGEVFEI